MKVAIHQPHYYPWIGYFEKIVKSDRFILLDEAQLTNSGYMHRNRFIDTNGNIKYVTIPYEKKDYMKLPYNKVKINNNIDWQKRNKNFLKATYSKSPYFDEIWSIISYQFENQYDYICSLAIESITLICKLFEIDTTLLFQQSIPYNQNLHRSDLVLELCKITDAKIYLAGNGGSKDYLDKEKFINNGVEIKFNSVTIPNYKQVNSKEFIGGISILDMLFNCGVEESKKIFWESVK